MKKTIWTLLLCAGCSSQANDNDYRSNRQDVEAPGKSGRSGQQTVMTKWGRISAEDARTLREAENNKSKPTVKTAQKSPDYGPQVGIDSGENKVSKLPKR